MKRFLKIVSSVIVTLLISVTSYAQLEVSAEIRPRGEFRRGYKSLIVETQKDNPSFVVSQRTRLSLDYSKGFMKARINFQDVRIWGDETIYTSTGVFGSEASVDLYEGWLHFDVFKNAFIRAGRQEWVYDDQRLLSKRNWNQHGLTYDGLLLGYRKDGLQIDGGFSWNNDVESLINEPYNPARIRTLDFLYLKNQFSEKFTSSLILLTNGYQKSDTSNTIYMRGTYGMNGWYSNELLNLHGGAYYQNGKNRKGDNVSAYAFFASVTMNINEWAFGPGIDWISGNDNQDKAGDDIDHLFDILYGARHGYYGYMDYFSNTARSTGGAGLVDAHFTVQRSIATKHQIELKYHYFLLQNNFYVETTPGNMESIDKYLASEADLVYTYKYDPSLMIQLGYSVFVPGSGMEIVNNVPEGSSLTGQWAWVMVTFKPMLFNSEAFIQKK